VRLDVHGDDEVARRAAGLAGPPLAAQADPLAVAHARCDPRGDPPPLDDDRHRRALDGLPERERRRRLEVLPADRAARPKAAARAAEQAAEDVLEAAAAARGVPHARARARAAEQATEDVLEARALR